MTCESGIASPSIPPQPHHSDELGKGHNHVQNGSSASFVGAFGNEGPSFFRVAKWVQGALERPCQTMRTSQSSMSLGDGERHCWDSGPRHT